MFNKKRLAMMAVAASMVLPTNLTYLSVATPVTVFAAEATVIADDTALTSNVETGTTLEVGYDKKYSTETVKFTGTDYKVTGDISLTKTIYIADDSTVNIEIAQGATISIPLQYGFLIGKNATLNITGEGTIKGTESTPASSICEMIRLNDESATLTLGNKLTFSQQTNNKPFTYGVVLGNGAKGSTVTIGEEGTQAGQGTTFTLDSALSIHGAIEIDDETTVTLNGATITTPDVGIYQAGYSELNVNDCTITSDKYSGIETRTGTLNVIGGTIKSKATTLESKASGNGTATKGAGIAIAQHKVSETNPRKLEVTIEDATLEGTASLLVSDPQGNQTDTEGLAENISIIVKNSTLTGDVAYTSDHIGFTLENLESTPEVKKFTGDGSGTFTEDTSEIDPSTIPYTIINESISSDDIAKVADEEDGTVAIELPEDQVEDEVLGSLLSGLTTAELVGEDGSLTPDSLKAALTQKSSQTVTEADNKAPKYEYIIEGLEGFELKAQNGGLALVAGEDGITISVKLQEDSNIKLTTEDGQEDSDKQDDPTEKPNDDGSEVETQMIEVLSESAEDGEESPADGGEEEPAPEEDTDVTEYVEVSALTTEGNSAEKINAYLSNTDSLKELKVDEEASKLPETLDTDTPIAITGTDAAVELDENNFITVHLTKKTEEVEEPIDLTSASSVVLNLKSDKSLDKVVVTLPASEEDGEETTVTIEASDIGEDGKYQIVDEEANTVDYSTITSSTTGLSIVVNSDKDNKHDITSIVIASDSGNGGTGSRPSKPKPEQPAEEPVVGTPTTMYRLYNKLTGEHLYTIDKNERDNLLTSDTWKDEGEGWIAPSVSDYPVYRLLNPNNGDHHYTTDKNEFDTLPSYGWIAEGVAFFSADKENPENVLLHRLYNPNAEGAGSHHYTADTNERDALVAQGWKYEGLAWAGLPANK